MTAWPEFSEADFDSKRAPRGAVAKNAAREGQPSLFFIATPAARPAKSTRLPEQLPGQGDLFGGGERLTGPLDLTGRVCVTTGHGSIPAVAGVLLGGELVPLCADCAATS